MTNKYSACCLLFAFCALLSAAAMAAAQEASDPSCPLPANCPDTGAAPADPNGATIPTVSGGALVIVGDDRTRSATVRAPDLARSQGGSSNASLPAGELTAPSSSRIAGPLTARSEFELFAEDAAGRPLEVYGRQLFNEVPTTFAPMDRIPVPADYVVGPGDELMIRVWGKIDLESSVTVDRNGQIFLPRVGALSVAGLQYQQLEGFLASAIGNLYKGFELNVTMGQLRSIQVYVLGSARQPGVYTVSSLSTLVNALFVCGGPSATGSMRHIQLRRNNQLLTELDIYDLLRSGDRSHDVQLLPGDVIYIPPVGPQVAIMGSVNEPGIYELKGETTVAAAFKSAGDVSNLATTDRVLLERVEDHRRRRVDDFSLNAAGLARLLNDGDMLQVFPISPEFENTVTLRGNVASPGRFPWHEGLRVSDLIPSRDFLVTRDYWKRQNHVAENVRDMMTDLSQDTAEINWDYAAIQRLDELDLSTRLIPFNLANAIEHPASSDNQILKPGDVITIFSRKDLPLPEDRHASFVRITGEVNVPGVYRIRPGENLRELVERAGGLTSHSYLYASQFTRESTRRIEQQQLQLSIQRMQTDLESQLAAGAASSMSGALAAQVSGQNALEQQSQLKTEKDLIDQLSGAQPTGRVVLGLRPDARAVADIPEFPLEDGDSFYIPPTLGTIQVSGEVYNVNAFRYQPRKRLGSYLRDSGGPARTADVRRIFLIRADGTVVSRQTQGASWSGDFDRIVLMPGDAIVVPPRLKLSSGFMAQLPLITQLLSQSAMTGAILSLVN